MEQTGNKIKETCEFMQLKPIGIVRNQLKEASWGLKLQMLTWQERVTRMRDQRKSVSEIIINPEFEKMLDGVDEFSHLMILYWSHLMPEERCMVAKIYPFGSKEFPEVGVFATHSPARPNRILVTTVRLLERNGNVLKVTGLDALNGSPVLDIKSHVPEQDSEESRIPDWHKKMREAFK